MRIKLAPCRYTRVHCANKPGLKGHLPLANLIEFHKLPTGLLLLQQSVLGPKDCSKHWRKFAKAEKWRKFPEIPCYSIVWYFLLVLRAIFDCESSCFYGIEVGWPRDQHGPPQHWKPIGLPFSLDIFGLEMTFFENQPMPKILHSCVSREWHDYYRVEFSTS